MQNNIAWPKDQFSAKNHVKIPYISASGPQNLVNCIIHGGPKPQVFGGSGTGAFGGLAGVLPQGRLGVLSVSFTVSRFPLRSPSICLSLYKYEALPLLNIITFTTHTLLIRDNSKT